MIVVNVKMFFSYSLFTITLIFFCAAHLVKETSQFENEGSECLILNTGKNGLCTQFKFCPKAIEALHHRKEYPQTCSFIKKQPVVCCEIDDDEEDFIVSGKPQRDSKTLTVSPSLSSILEVYKRPGEIQRESKNPLNETISYKKCQEYEDTQSCSILQPGFGGREARLGQYRHMALLGYGGPNDKQWNCAGSLISERFILTAAHCLNTRDFGRVKFVRLGVLNKNEILEGENPQDFLVIQTFTPTDYTSTSLYHDIALLKLDRDVIFTNNIKPVCLYGKLEIEDDIIASGTGWGPSSFGAEHSDHLLYTRLYVQTFNSCNASYKSSISKKLQYGIDPVLQFCAGGRNGEDACEVSAGGALQFPTAEFKCSYWIVGVISFAKACGISNIPGVYTRVSAYIPWIEKVVWRQ